MNANLYTVFRDRFHSSMDRPFLVVPGGPTWTYSELDETTARISAVLRDHGVTKGERVVVQVAKSPMAVALYLACLRVGAVYVPLNDGYAPAEVTFFVDDAEPAVVVLDPQAPRPEGADSLLTLDAAGAGTLALFVRDASPDGELAVMNGDDRAAMCYTSGTTGRSKGAILTTGNLTSNAVTLHEVWGFEPGDVLLHILPVFHVHGLFVALHTALLNASTVVFLPRFDVDAVLAALPSASVVMGVPTHYARLLADGRMDRDACRSIRLFVSGSAPLLSADFDAFHTRTGHVILERYGMTETGMITSNPLDGERVAGSVGYALPGVDVRVVTDDGTLAAPGEAGAVEVRGPNVFAGYWKLPDKTTEAFRPDGFFVTGDIGEMAADGRLTLVGRASDLIISGGYNIYPAEVENALDELGQVRESAVIGVPHPDMGEGIVAIVVPAEAGFADAAALKAALVDKLARFKQPRKIAFVDELPKNGMGKVQKNLLRDAYAATFTVT